MTLHIVLLNRDWLRGKLHASAGIPNILSLCDHHGDDCLSVCDMKVCRFRLPEYLKKQTNELDPFRAWVLHLNNNKTVSVIKLEQLKRKTAPSQHNNLEHKGFI